MDTVSHSDTAVSGPMLIAHRGASGYRPEHTASSFELALELGVDVIELDLVPSADGVLVVRHEPEIGATTDIARRADFEDRRLTKTVDGVEVTGWFAEDFTWDELATLRCRERMPHLRPGNRDYNDREPILQFGDVLDLLERHNATAVTPVGLVVELKHPTYFTRMGFDVARMVHAALRRRPWGGQGYPLWIACFERTALVRLRDADAPGGLVYLAAATGSAADDVAALGDRAPGYADALTEEGLADLAEIVNGIGPAWQRLIYTSGGRPGYSRGVAEAAHEVGLDVFAWTLSPENQFLADPWKRGPAPAQWGNWRNQFAAVIDTGVDGVLTDFPDLVADIAARAA